MAMVLRRIRGGLLGTGAAAGPLFVSTFTLLGARRAGYDARLSGEGPIRRIPARLPEKHGHQA